MMDLLQAIFKPMQNDSESSKSYVKDFENPER